MLENQSLLLPDPVWRLKKAKPEYIPDIQEIILKNKGPSHSKTFQNYYQLYQLK